MEMFALFSAFCPAYIFALGPLWDKFLLARRSLTILATESYTLNHDSPSIAVELRLDSDTVLLLSDTW